MINNIIKCDSCGKATSFERTDPETQPPEGDMCPVCGGWVCNDCYDWKNDQCDLCTHVEKEANEL